MLFGGVIIVVFYLKEFIELSMFWVYFDVMVWNVCLLLGCLVGGEVLGICVVFNYL